MRIRVLHVIDHLGYGGAPLVVKGLVERMPADRIESEVCALRPNPRPIPLGVPVTTLTSHKYSPAAIQSIAHLCKTRRIDIIHAHLQRAFLSSLLATYLGSGRLVLHEHGPIFRGGTGCLYRTLLRRLGPRADVIIANSEAAKAAVCRTLRRPEVPVAVVPNFLDPAQFDPDRYDRGAARKSLGLGPEQFAVGFVGRLDRAKGADLLIEAAALLRDQQDAYRFILVGDGPERSSLEARIRRLGLDRMVTLAGLQENPAAVMRAFDAGVVPSRREAFGLAALELMRMKVPVIVAPVGGLPELVRDGQSGIILPRLLPSVLAESIRRLRENRALRERLGQSAFAHASLFDGRAAVARVVEIYERLMAQGQTRET